MGTRGKATFIATILFFITIAFSDDASVIPADKPGMQAWFMKNVAPLAGRSGLDGPLVAAEANRKVINVKSDGSGDFKSINDAIASIPNGNTGRVIINLGGGVYNEKIKIERMKPFVTLLGDAMNMPTLVYSGTAKEYGTVDSATLIVESDYFSAVNVIIKNSAPRPDGSKPLQQAVALRISGDKSSLYNCRFIGFQDTLCDDKGNHFFKNCYIEGTVDFIFGSGKSLYLNSELHVISGEAMAMITANARHTATEDTAYSFVHCSVTGTGGIAALGRAWFPYPHVSYAYTDMSDAVTKEGWSLNRNPANEKTVVFREYKNKGVGSNMAGRKYVKTLTDVEAQPYLSLAFIKGSSWLLPPTTL